MLVKIKYLFLFVFIFDINISAQDLLVFTPKQSPYLPVNDSVLVYIPGEESKMPLLIMLNGWSGNYQQWGGLIDLQQYSENFNFLIACPDGLYDSWYVNSTEIQNQQMENFIVKTLLPELEKKYSIDTSLIFITGLSMGGHGAILMMLKHPEIFAAAGSTSGILDISAFPSNWAIEKVLGSYSASPQNWDKNNCTKLLEKFTDKKLRMIVDCGTEDFASKVNKNFAGKCAELNIPLKFIEQPGTHSKNYWSNSIDEHFWFFYNIVKELRDR